MIGESDISDDYFKHWSRDADTDEPNADMMAKMGALMGAMGAYPELANPTADLPAARIAMTSVLNELSKAQWPNWEETQAKVDQKVVLCDVGGGTQIYNYVLKPKESEGPLPCLVYYHGGGGIQGTPVECLRCFRDFALKANCVVVMPQYRLVPNVKQPVPQHDGKHSFLHFHKNAAEFGIDASRMAVAGESGGGTPAVGLCRLLIESGEISKVRACYAWEPMIGGYYFDVEDDKLCRGENMVFVKMSHGAQGYYGLHSKDPEKEIAERSVDLFPARMSDEQLAQMPPTIPMTFSHDFYRREAYEFGKRLMKVGKLSEFCDIAGYMHGTMFDSTMPDADRFWTGFRESFKAHTV